MNIKIIDRYKTCFSSSTHPKIPTDDEISILINHDCKCDNCGESIFEMGDFPEILVEDDRVLCEECYADEYRDICPICEDSYEKASVECEAFPQSPFFYYNPASSDEDREKFNSIYCKESGVYEAIKFPIYSGATGNLGLNKSTWITFATNELQELFIVTSSTSSNDAFKVFIMGGYCYVNTRHLFDHLKYDYANNVITFNIIQVSGEANTYSLQELKTKRKNEK